MGCFAYCRGDSKKKVSSSGSDEIGTGDLKVTFVCEAFDITYVRLANQGENATPPSAPDLSERGLENIGIIGNYENLQHDEVCVFKYKVADDTTRVGILLNDATGYNMADFWIYCATGVTITVTHADGTILTHVGTNAYHNFNHDYTGWTAFDAGEIVIDTDSGEGSYYFAGLTKTTGTASKVIMDDALQYVYCSDDIINIDDEFLRYASVKNIITPNNLTNEVIGDTFMRYATNIETIVFCNVISIGTSFCYGASSLKFLFILDATTIGSNFCRNAYSLKTIETNSLATIGLAFCFSVVELTSLSLNTISPPAVADGNMLANVSKSCIIYVPLASLTAYKTNTNMTHLANQMVGY